MHAWHVPLSSAHPQKHSSTHRTLDDAVNKAANMAGRARECEGQPTAQPEQPGLKKEVDKPGPMINDTDPDKLGPDSPKNIRNENPY